MGCGITILKVFCAELLGTFILVFLGDASVAQVTLGNLKNGGSFYGSAPSIALTYGFALTVAVLVSGKASGAHLNPAVTLSLAAARKCSWVYVPVYMLAQYLGAFLAATVLYGYYYDIFMTFGDPGALGISTAGIFATYPNGFYKISTTTMVFEQILGTAMLLIVILSVTDAKNMNVPSGLAPLMLGVGLATILNSMSLNAGCAINPARDFSPRLLTYIAGWSLQDTFDAFDNFFWIPLTMPHIGGLLGTLIYYGMIKAPCRLEQKNEGDMTQLP